jgi:hypothetical protein
MTNNSENSMTFRDFPGFDEITAPAAARDALAQTKRQFGMIPGPLARYASSPLMLGAALSGLDAFEKTSLAPLEREVLAMTSITATCPATSGPTFAKPATPTNKPWKSWSASARTH